MLPYLFHKNYLGVRNPGQTPARDWTDPGQIRDWLNDRISAAVRSWKRRRMTASLQAMSDRTLRDLGLYRSSIPSVVDGFSDRELAMIPMAEPEDWLGQRDSWRPGRR